MPLNTTSTSKSSPVMRRRNAPESAGGGSPAPASDRTASGTKVFPTGCSLLNLALSDLVAGGYGVGYLFNMIGDSFAGKSILALTGMAEMANDSKWDDYALIYSCSEPPNFDIAKLLGRKLRARLNEGWNYVADVCGLDEFHPPITIQDYYERGLRLMKEGRPIFDVLDSLDKITTDEEMKRADQISKGKRPDSYKTEKARWLSEILRNLGTLAKSTNSGLGIVSQTRDNLEPIGYQGQEAALSNSTPLMSSGSRGTVASNPVRSRRSRSGSTL